MEHVTRTGMHEQCPLCDWILTDGECELCGYVTPDLARQEQLVQAGIRLAHDVPGMTPEEGRIILCACADGL